MKAEQPQGEISTLVSVLKNEVTAAHNLVSLLYDDLGYVLSDAVTTQTAECGPVKASTTSALGGDLNKLVDEISELNNRISDIRRRLQL